MLLFLQSKKCCMDMMLHSIAVKLAAIYLYIAYQSRVAICHHARVKTVIN